MAQVKIPKFTSQGEQKLQTVRLNADYSDYESDCVQWQGETEFEFTPKRTVTEIASGNDPGWAFIQGHVTGDVKLKISGIPIDKMEHLFGVKYNATDGLCVGDIDDETRLVGLTIDTIVKTDGVTSTNKTILYKVRFDLPAIKATTINKDDTAVADVEVSGVVYPLLFTKRNGENGARTYCVVNSVLNPTKFQANASTIEFPTEISSNPSSSNA